MSQEARPPTVPTTRLPDQKILTHIDRFDTFVRSPTSSRRSRPRENVVAICATTCVKFPTCTRIGGCATGVCGLGMTTLGGWCRTGSMHATVGAINGSGLLALTVDWLAGRAVGGRVGPAGVAWRGSKGSRGRWCAPGCRPGGSSGRYCPVSGADAGHFEYAEAGQIRCGC